MDGGRLATSAKPPQFCIVSDSRHGRKEWFAGDDSFGTAADALASLLDPGINDGVSSCWPNTMDSRLSQSQIDRILRDAGRLGTSTKDAQPPISRNSRHGRSPLRSGGADCSEASCVRPVSFLQYRTCNVLKDTRGWNTFSGQYTRASQFQIFKSTSCAKHAHSASALEWENKRLYRLNSIRVRGDSRSHFSLPRTNSLEF